VHALSGNTASGHSSTIPPLSAWPCGTPWRAQGLAVKEENQSHFRLRGGRRGGIGTLFLPIFCFGLLLLRLVHATLIDTFPPPRVVGGVRGRQQKLRRGGLCVYVRACMRASTHVRVIGCNFELVGKR